MSTLWTHDRRFDCSQAELYRLLQTPEFEQTLGQKMELNTETMDREETSDGVRLTLRVLSNRKLPAFMHGLVGKHNGWIEIRHWRDEICGYDWEVRTLSERIPIQASGVVRVDAAGADGAVRHAEGTFEAKVPLIGRKIEGYLVQRTDLAFDTSAGILRNMLSG